jgi:hypothetical protein
MIGKTLWRIRKGATDSVSVVGRDGSGTGEMVTATANACDLHEGKYVLLVEKGENDDEWWVGPWEV